MNLYFCNESYPFHYHFFCSECDFQCNSLNPLMYNAPKWLDIVGHYALNG